MLLDKRKIAQEETDKEHGTVKLTLSTPPYNLKQ